MHDYPNFDLNQLRCLDALLHECNVTRAAQRVQMTQPALSRVLGQLRLVFDDPLFVRCKGGMQPTTRALSLRRPVADILSGIQSMVLGGNSFEAQTTELSFAMATTDYTGYLVVPPLLSALRRLAPKARLVTKSISSEHVAALEERSVDLMIDTNYRTPDLLLSQDLFRDRFVCLVARATKIRDLTLDTYAEMPHLLVAPGEQPGGIVDKALNKIGRTRNVAVQISSFSNAAQLIACSDLIATLPRKVASLACESLPLEIFEPPIELSPFSMTMYWHPRDDTDPAMRWFRRQVLLAAQ